MQKPTIILNYKIIEFVLRNPKVLELIHERDNQIETFGVELVCKFFRENQINEHLSLYKVDFIYDTRNIILNNIDDISVFVEVNEGNPYSLRITEIKTM